MAQSMGLVGASRTCILPPAGRGRGAGRMPNGGSTPRGPGIPRLLCSNKRPNGQCSSALAHNPLEAQNSMMLVLDGHKVQQRLVFLQQSRINFDAGRLLATIHAGKEQVTRPDVLWILRSLFLQLRLPASWLHRTMSTLDLVWGSRARTKFDILFVLSCSLIALKNGESSEWYLDQDAEYPVQYLFLDVLGRHLPEDWFPAGIRKITWLRQRGALWSRLQEYELEVWRILSFIAPRSVYDIACTVASSCDIGEDITERAGELIYEYVDAEPVLAYSGVPHSNVALACASLKLAESAAPSQSSCRESTVQALIASCDGQAAFARTMQAVVGNLEKLRCSSAPFLKLPNTGPVLEPSTTQVGGVCLSQMKHEHIFSLPFKRSLHSKLHYANVASALVSVAHDAFGDDFPTMCEIVPPREWEDFSNGITSSTLKDIYCAPIWTDTHWASAVLLPRLNVRGPCVAMFIDTDFSSEMRGKAWQEISRIHNLLQCSWPIDFRVSDVCVQEGSWECGPLTAYYVRQLFVQYIKGESLDLASFKPSDLEVVLADLHCQWSRATTALGFRPTLDEVINLEENPVGQPTSAPVAKCSSRQARISSSVAAMQCESLNHVTLSGERPCSPVARNFSAGVLAQVALVVTTLDAGMGATLRKDAEGEDLLDLEGAEDEIIARGDEKGRLQIHARTFGKSPSATAVVDGCKQTVTLLPKHLA
jgi:hypothetical protein